MPASYIPRNETFKIIFTFKKFGVAPRFIIIFARQLFSLAKTFGGLEKATVNFYRGTYVERVSLSAEARTLKVHKEILERLKAKDN